jgi:hypothetical protein
MSNDFDELRRYIAINPEDHYLKSAMPSARDSHIATIIGRVRTEADYHNAVAALGGLRETLLPAFAQRMSVIAVRKADISYVLDGLRAILVANAVENARELVILLALLWHSAELIDGAAVLAFEHVANTSGRYGEPIRAFMRRIPSERSISAMCYSAIGRGDTFNYKCDW